MYKDIIEQGIAKILKQYEQKIPSLLYKSISYSVNNGGKRVRPTLMLMSAKMLNIDIEKVLPLAIALEFIHTYSLIHDDLPSMDNDNLRRGCPTNHIVFGEGNAILAGDGLLNLAFEILFDASLVDESLLPAAKFVCNSSGVLGMVGGQSIDINQEEYTKQEILNMYSLKTGALIKSAIIAPSMIKGQVLSVELEDINTFASNIGLAFQLADDIIDFLDGSDKDKITFVTTQGLENAKVLLQNTITNCQYSYKKYSPASDEILDFMCLLAERKR